MNKLITFLGICTTVAILALPAAAHTIAQDQCSTEGKNALYKTFLDNRKTAQDKAYDAAKKYLACPPGGEVTEATQKIIDYLKKWSTAYDEGSRKSKLPALLYNEHKYPEAYALGRELLAADPENLKVLIDLGANGYLVTSLNQPQLNTEHRGDRHCRAGSGCGEHGTITANPHRSCPRENSEHIVQQ